ncbi:MAG TPA: MarR family transcriptional regulator [Cytophagales bacterium]|nr:MarR family transcriptional regulator [Cytophagales bacterium]
MMIEEVIKQKFEDSHQKAVVNLIYTGNWMRDKQHGLFRSYEILPQHYNILRILKGKYPKPVSPGEIKEVMLDKGNDVTRLLDKLVNKGWVKRGLCEENRRKMDVVITAEGLAFVEELSIPIKSIHEDLKKSLSKEEAEQLSSLLDKLRG